MEAQIVTKSNITAYGIFTTIEVGGREFVSVSAELDWRDDTTLDPAKVNWSSIGNVDAASATAYAQALMTAAGIAAGYDANRAALVELVQAERTRLEAAKAAREAQDAQS